MMYNPGKFCMISSVGVMKMGSELIFDTLQYANRLKAAGVPEKQAEAQAEALREIMDAKLATKKDLEQVRKDLELAVELAKNELKRDIKDLELHMTLKLGSLMVGGIGLLVILMKLFKL